jgi:16S rRNA (guanine527-N7)-methyltransferase
LTTELPPLLDHYVKAVLDAPRELHLTSENDRPLFQQRHVADAQALLHTYTQAYPPPSPAKVLDVGTGNGVPGMVLAILRPDWQVDLVDSNAKKSGFLDTFSKSHAMPNVQVFWDRAEKLGHMAQRESYDLVFCRALSKLPTALELTLPFLKVGGQLIVSHGTSWPEELKRSETALTKLQAEFIKTVHYAVPNIEGDFVALIFTKKVPTPKQYPRNVGIPDKRPL